MATFAASDSPQQQPPTGASLAWTSNDALVLKARGLVENGRFDEAEAVLRSGEHARTDRTEMLELIRRIRHDYALDEAGLLKKLQAGIPDVTASDVARWRAAGEVQHRVIDGKVWYFRREPSNIYRFCAEAKFRRDEHLARSPRKTPEKAPFVLGEHLQSVIAEAKRTGNVQVSPVRHRIRYTLTVPANAKGMKAGAVVRCWLPYPQEYRQQTEVRLVSSSPGQPQMAENGIRDDVIRREAQRTLYFEQKVADPSTPITFAATFEYTSSAYYPVLDEAQAKPYKGGVDAQYLAERLPHIAFTHDLRKTVEKVIGKETNPLRKAQRIFEYIDTHIRYHAEEEYGNIASFASKALACRRGDCGVQGMLFITMCRAAGIPARWQSGWQTKPGQLNMHDWAEFYIEPWGWLPADPSYGLQASNDPAVRWFYLGHQDSYRLIVNLDYGSPLTPPKESLRSEPADFQRGEVEIDGRNLYFDEWDYDFMIESQERL